MGEDSSMIHKVYSCKPIQSFSLLQIFYRLKSALFSILLKMTKLRSNAAYQRRMGGLSKEQKNLIETSPLLISPSKASLEAFLEHSESVLEVGFGTGDYLLNDAQNRPQTRQIGMDLYLFGVAATIQKSGFRSIDNIRVIHDDAYRFFTSPPAESLFNTIRIYHPDPWPKKRHHKRRLITPESLEGAWSLLKPGGCIEILSDDPDYTEWIYDTINQTLPHSACSVENNLSPRSKYGEKAIAAGRSITFFSITRDTSST